METISISTTLPMASSCPPRCRWRQSPAGPEEAAGQPGRLPRRDGLPHPGSGTPRYGERIQLIQALEKKYPQLADLSVIGKSRMGREQHLLTITAKATGAPETKPAMWVDGAIHGNEINGITCALYTAWYLLTRYDYDPYVRRIVDSTTFYILPGLNVDANDSYVVSQHREQPPRALPARRR